MSVSMAPLAAPGPGPPWVGLDRRSRRRV